MVRETSDNSREGCSDAETASLRETLRKQREERNRREFLAMVGTAGAVGLAGCSGGDDDDEGNGSSDNDGNGGTGNDNDENSDSSNDENSDSSMESDATFRAGNVPANPNENPLNSYNPNSWANWWAGRNHNFRRPFYYSVNDDEWVPGLAEDWSIEGNEVLITVSDKYTWSNGRTVDVQDFIDKYTIEIEAGFQPGDVVESVQRVDDSTVSLTLNEQNTGTSPAVIGHTIFSSNMQIDTPRELFGDLVKRFRNASSQDETDDVLKDLTEASWDITDEWIFNGLWVIDDADENRLLLKKRDDDPDAGGINFSKWAIPVESDQEAEFLSGSIDAAFSQDAAGAPDKYEPLGFVPVFQGIGVSFNHGDKWFGHPGVRKAIGHMIDNVRYNKAVKGGTKIPMDVHTGMAREYAETQMGDVADSLEDFTAQNFDRAKEHLEAAGFSKSGGTWKDPDGDEFKPTYVAKEGDAEAAQFVANAIKDFGIDAEGRIESKPVYKGLIEKGDWQMTRDFWGYSWFTPIPWDNFRNSLQGRAKEQRNIASEWEVPMPPGDRNGEMQTINVDEKINQLKTAKGEEAATLIKEIGWAWNYSLPHYQVYTYGDTFHFNTEDWEYPDGDHRVWNIPHPPYLLAQWGLLQAKN